jgi:hypothetical protein
MSTLERAEESSLPSTAPDLLQKRQETDAPAPKTLERSPHAVPNLAPEPKPKAGYIPPKDMEVNTMFDEVVAGFTSYVTASRGNRKMRESRQAELDQDYDLQQQLKTEAASYYTQAQQEAPTVKSVDEADDLESSIRYGLGLVGQAIPSVGLSVVGGFGGGILGKTARAFVNPTLKRFAQPAGAFVGATGIVYPDVKGAIVAQQENDPEIASRPVEQREQAAVLTALGSSALEGLVPAAIGNRSLRMGSKRPTPNRWRTAATDTVGEGLTEVSQLGLEELSHELQNNERPHTASVSDYIDNFLGGIAGGVAAHGIGRGLEGLDKFASGVPVTPNAFGILGGQLADTASASKTLTQGAAKGEIDVMPHFLPVDLLATIREFGSDTTGLLNLHKDKQTAMNFMRMAQKNGMTTEQSVEAVHQAQAIALLTEVANDKSTGRESTELFQQVRQRAIDLVYPNDPQGEDKIDSILEYYRPEDSNVTQDLSDKQQTSERVLEYQQDAFPTSTDETNAFGDPSGLNLSVPDSAIEFLFNITDQNTRKGEDEVLYRPAFNPEFTTARNTLTEVEEEGLDVEAEAEFQKAYKTNPNTTTTREGVREALRESAMANGNVHSNPWETAKLENELNKVRADRGVDPSVVPVTRMLDAKNLDPVIYAESLLSDIEERIKRNRQDTQGMLDEKGIDTEGTPFTQEQVLENLNLQADNLFDLLESADGADGAKNLYTYLKDNYKVGALDSLPISRELDVSEGDVEGFRLLSRRFKEGSKKRKGIEKLMLTPVKLARDANGNVTDEIIETLEPIVSESVINHMRTKGKSRANTFMSSSKDGVTDQQLFSEGIAGMMAAGLADGFLDPSSKTPKVYKTVRSTRDNQGNPIRVPEGKPGIPQIQLKRFPYKSLGKQRGDFFEKAQAVKQAVEAASEAINDPLFNVAPEDFKKRADLLGDAYTDAYDYLIDLTGGPRPGVSRKSLLEAAFRYISQAGIMGVEGQQDLQGEEIEGSKYLFTVEASRMYQQSTTQLLDDHESFNFKTFISDLVKANRQAQEDITSELMDVNTTDERKAKLKEAEQELVKEQVELSKAKVSGLSRVRKGDNTIRNFKDPATAIEFIMRYDAAIGKVGTLERNYIADIATLLSIISKTYKSAKKVINEKVELHIDDGPRTIESGAQASAIRNDLKLRKNGLSELKSLLYDKRSATDEIIQDTGRDQIQEGGYSALSEAEKFEQGYSPFQDSDEQGKQTTYDPAAQPIPESTVRARRTQDRNEQRLQDEEGIFVREPRKSDFFKDGLTPLDTARRPAGIPVAQKSLAETTKGTNAQRITAREQEARDTMRVFITDLDGLATRSTGMAALNDLESTDVAYVLVKDIASITDKKRARTTYMTKLMDGGANIYLASRSFAGKNKEAQLEQFIELMAKNGYEAHPNDASLFVSTNSRTYKRNTREYEKVVEAWQEQQDSIEEIALNPEHPENKQAEARYRHFGGKQGKLGRAHKNRADKVKKGEDIDTIVENVKEQIKRNREETAAAIEVLTDYRTEAARDLFAAYIKNLDFSDDALQARKDLHRLIHGNKRVVAQMKELLKDNPLNKADQKKLETDPDFATAVAFQMWANGDLNVSTAAQGWFKKIVTRLMNVLGLTLGHQNGEAIFTMFKNGDLTESSNIRNVYRTNRRGLDNVYRDLSKGYSSFAKRLVRSSTDVLRQTRIPELLELADLFQVAEINDKNSNLGFLPKRKQQIGKWNAAFAGLIDNYTDAELEAGYEEVRSGKTPKTKAGKQILDFQVKFYRYMEGTGVQVTALRKGKIKTVPIGER